MNTFNSPATTSNFSTNNVYFSKNVVLSLMLVVALISSAVAQKLNITEGSNLVLNGSVSLVLNNTAFQNNGTFSAGKSTVIFSGHNDTLKSYVAGNSITTFRNVSVSKSDKGVAFKSAVIVEDVLAVNGGNLYTDDNLTLKSDVNLTARVAAVATGSEIIGKANVQRYLPAKRAWRLMTAPVTKANSIYNSWQNGGIYTKGIGTLITGPNPSAATGNGLDYSAQNTVSMKSFNAGSQQFSNVTNTKGPISNGASGNGDNIGYFIFIRGDRNPINTNAPNVNTTTITSIGDLQTGIQTFQLSSKANGYTLIGNPYASPVNFDNVSRSNAVKRFYAWDPSLNTVGGYVMMDDVNNDGIYVKSVAGSNQTKELQSSQAVFVQTKKNGAATLTFNESSKSTNNNSSMFRPLSGNSTTGTGTGSIEVALNLLNADGSTTLADGTIAEFDNVYSAEFDDDDAVKFGNTNENLSIVRNNVSLTAERRPALGFNDTVYFKLTNITQRTYQFVFNITGLEQPGMNAFLEDSYLGTSAIISLSGATAVNFTVSSAAASSVANRFRIVFKPAVGVLPVTFNKVRAAKTNGNITVEWEVENEINMVKYEVEKSVDGANFIYQSTKNVTGTNNANNTYSWIDVNAVEGTNFYRIKSFDKNGTTKYSEIVKVAIGTKTGGFSIYPNPVSGNVINLVINNQPAGVYQVKLTNISGQVLFVKSFKSNGNGAESLNTGSKLITGIYQLEIIGTNNKSDTQKVFVQ
ncbi:hypothetical protein BH11BAC3_BH11BAC3_18110 [soil metagenome]